MYTDSMHNMYERDPINKLSHLAKGFVDDIIQALVLLDIYTFCRSVSYVC